MDETSYKPDVYLDGEKVNGVYKVEIKPDGIKPSSKIMHKNCVVDCYLVKVAHFDDKIRLHFRSDN